jgi:hypothetical protein
MAGGLCQSRPLKQQRCAGFADPHGHGPFKTASFLRFASPIAAQYKSDAPAADSSLGVPLAAGRAQGAIVGRLAERSMYDVLLEMRRTNAIEEFRFFSRLISKAPLIADLCARAPMATQARSFAYAPQFSIGRLGKNRSYSPSNDCRERMTVLLSSLMRYASRFRSIRCSPLR